MKKKKAVLIAMMLVLTAVGTLTLVAPPAGALVEPGVHDNPVPPGCAMIDFEDGSEAQIILNTIPGLQFTTTYGIDWRYADITTGLYNVNPYGTQIYECNGNFFAWLGVTGDTGRIDFTEGTASYFSVLTSTASGLTIDAYDASDTYLATSGWATDNSGTGTMTRLTINQPGMAYVIIHDTGNYWLIDDLVTDAPGVERILDKTISPTEGDLGDHPIHVTIDVNAREGETAWVVDELPPELSYITGNFWVNGVPAIPYICGDYIIYEITGPGEYVIEFELKVTEAKSWEEMIVENWAYAYWYDESGAQVDMKSDMEPFTVLPFEELHKNVGIPKADVVFSFDLTASMTVPIEQAKAEATTIVNDLQTLISDVAFGVVSHVDYPYYYSSCGYADQYGDDDGDLDGYGDIFGDYAYNTDLDITENAANAIATISGLSTTYWGGDGPQDYSRVLYETQFLNWRDDAVKLVVLFGDDIPHDCDYWAWSTGVDPGRDAIIGTGDDLDFQTVVADLASQGIKVLAVDCSVAGWASAFYQYLADETGGEYFTLGTTDVPEVVKELIKAEADEVEIIEKTKVQWPVFIDVINPFDYTMTDTVISDRFGGELMIDYIIAGDTTYEFYYHDYEKKKAEVDIWINGAYDNTHKLDKKGVTLGAEPYEFNIYWTGRTHKIHFEWTIGDIPPDDPDPFIGIIIGVSTDENPAEHQEYTTPDIYDLNSGATLKFIDPEQDMQLSAYTDHVYVTVLPEEP